MSVLIPNSRTTIQADGSTLVDITNLKNIGATVAGIGVGSRWSTLRNVFATSGYQVTTGKTFRILTARLQLLAGTGTGATTNGWGYSDNDLGLNASSTPAGAVEANISVGPDRNGTVTWQVGLKAEVPALKYIFVRSDGGDSNLSVYGYEV